MKNAPLILTIFLLSGAISYGQYTDHRDHELDSLETVVAPWTEARMANATPEEKSMIADAWHDLMWGYSNISPGRSMYFARRNMELCLKESWLNQALQSAKMIGQHHWASGQIDSAMTYFNMALAIADRMALKESLPGKPDGYKQSTIDDAYSGIYGAIGNLYASIDSIPRAMEYYRKCGDLLEKNGWNESCSVLYQNMGETWLDAGNLKEAGTSYNKALQFGKVAEDSLLIANAQAGLGALYLEQGKTSKALQQLKFADEYFSTHEDQEYRSRLYTLDVTGKVLEAQKRQTRTIAIGAFVLAALLLCLVLLLIRALHLSKEKRAANEVIGEIISESEEKAPATGVLPKLTDRERDILALVAKGLTNKEIASKLYLTEQTIKWYRMRLTTKFEAKNASELIVKAKELGVV
ncbi:MAG: LuxR family transcriptional regulator [Bacteroidales bacterium]|nr:LuxR family transcriptional regulator [Bacteroidales bacterium]